MDLSQTFGRLSDRLTGGSLLPPDARNTDTIRAYLNSPNLMLDTLMPDRGTSTLERLKAGPSAADVLNIAGGPNTAMFLGPMARTADKAALALAKQMTERAFPREQVWDATGWFQGKDGKWRFEVPDDALRVPDVSGQRTTLGLQGELAHPEVSAAYPWEGARILTRTNIGEADQPQGGYASRGNDPYHKIDVQGPDRAGARSAAAHELQHFVQNQEDFARGTNPTYVRDYVIPRLTKDWSPEKRALVTQNADDLAGTLYRQNAGEVEARNVQTRLDMTAAERKKTPPWMTQDVPDELQTVFGVRNPAEGVAKALLDALANPRGRHALDR